jgi:hypothetical protein
VLALALVSIGLGLVPLTSFEILQIGRGGEVPVPILTGALIGVMEPLPGVAGLLQ